MIGVMVVDDEEDLQFLFEQEFYIEIEKDLINFQFALTGQEAIDKLEQKSNFDKIDYVISDIRMPGINGLELLRIIKQTYPNIKVIMVTASAKKDNYDKAKEYGADDYIIKPIDFDTLRKQFFNN